MTELDHQLLAYFPASGASFEATSKSYLEFARELVALDGFRAPIVAQAAEDTPLYDVLEQPEGFFDVWAPEDPEQSHQAIIGLTQADPFYTLEFRWRSPGADVLSLDLRSLPLSLERAEQSLLSLVDLVTRWRRPLHLFSGPGSYRMGHHPLDPARNGIGWIGWVPFLLTEDQVPEADLVVPLNDGTLIMTQKSLWQVDDAEAIARAQDVEIRLNMLGVLPTHLELASGSWGDTTGGARQ